MHSTMYIENTEQEYSGLGKWFLGEGERISIYAFFSAFSAAVLAYHFLVIFGAGNPDALAEGLLVYTGYDWALACGRWAIRYMSRFLSGNIVIPGLWIPLYTCCCAMSSVLICRLWGIRRLSGVCLVSILFTVNPTVIEQSLLQYMFMAWGISNLLCVLFAFLNISDSNLFRAFLLYPILIAVAFGLYQACMGLLCLVMCMTLILGLLRGERLDKLFMLCLKYAFSLLLGVALYFVIMRFELNRWGEQESGRLLAFSVKEIFASLPVTVPAAYKTFFAYFFEGVFRRSTIYKILFAIAFVGVLLHSVRLIRKAKAVHGFAALLLVLLIPACANISDIVFPYNKPVLIMQYQSMLVIPFILAIIERLQCKKIELQRICCKAVAVLMVFLAWGYIVSANATYRVYERAYEHTYAAVASALDRVYALPDYYHGEPIAFAGFPDDSAIRSSEAAKYAYGDYENLIFWEGFAGLQGGRTNYLRYFFGVDGGVLPYEKYIELLESDEFKKMNIFPMENSVSRIDGLIIVKFDDEFPVYG